MAGVLFLVLGLGFLVLGAVGKGAPGPLSALPLPPDVVMPFIFWQLATWAILFGIFFLRPRGTRKRGAARRLAL